MTKPWDPQPCKNGCGVTIYLEKVGAKWIPHEVTNGEKTMNKHDCPKSEYNLNKTVGDVKAEQNKAKQSLDEYNRKFSKTDDTVTVDNKILLDVIDSNNRAFDILSSLLIKLGLEETAKQIMDRYKK